MADNFHVFARAVRKQFEQMSQSQLFVVSGNNDAIWDRYLSAFPAGTNPMFRERTEHDCSCCRHFIRDIGHVVAIQNGALTSIWDLNGLPHPYQAVADAMADYVKGLRIRDVFLAWQAKHGVPTNHGLINGATVTFSHFAVEAPKKFVVDKATIDQRRGDIRTTVQVMARGIAELSPDAVTTVADLIEQNALYRGQEHKRAVLEFQQLQARVRIADGPRGELMLWTLADSPAARFRNSVIGTLVQDLSDGMDLEAAVRAFEIKVAPQNYKRPTALITKSMVDSAMKTINELGLDQALDRRHARLSDVSVNSVLFVDNSVRGKMKDGIAGLLMAEIKPAPFDPKKAVEIGVNAFMADVLPKATGLRLYLDNGLMGNFVSLTAPAHSDSKSLFRWSNDFAWSYDGNVTDTIKDKVKRAGGQVENVAMRVSLAWFNTDDLDLHVIEPNLNHVYFGNKSGKLDVDMNVRGETRDPVENMRWVRTPIDGIYKVAVHNFSRRESVDVGFVVEIESAHGLDTFRFEKALSNRLEQPVAEIMVNGGQIRSIKASTGIIAGSASRDHWGLKTLNLVKVNSIVLSPNYWDNNSVGNKHWLFMLDGCRNPLPTRGIYNEFLHPKLEKHRKVFEVLGDKTKCPVAEDQLSGLGFSSTRKDRVTVVASGPTLNKAYTIVFGTEKAI